jgi:hypothetical protein
MRTEPHRNELYDLWMSRFDVMSLSLLQRRQTRKDAPCRSVRTHLWPKGHVQKQRQCARLASVTRRHRVANAKK